MIKIFVWVANVTDGAAISRVHSVKHLEETGFPVKVQMANNISDFDIDWADIVLIHRVATQQHLSVARVVKSKNKKLWVDNDDDYFNIPIDHKAHLYYAQPEIRNLISDTTKLADLMSVSNPLLLETFSGLCENNFYYPCSYDERLMPEPEYTPRNKKIIWRGSDTHSKSLVEVAESICRIDKAFNGWEFIFLGAYPWQVLEKITKNNWYCDPNYIPTQKLWHMMRGYKPAIQIMPLTDNRFTRSRSNMAMIDGTIAGAVTLAKDFDHFKEVEGCYVYSDVEDFQEKLEILMGDYEASIVDYCVINKKCWKYIQKHLTFKAVNEIQWEKITALIGGVK